MEQLPDGTTREHVCRIPELAVAESERAGVPLVHTVTLLDLESSGGLNIWGPLPESGCGQPHRSPVTRESYEAYLARRDECGDQGCGILQITWHGLQDLGEIWRPEINVRIGLAEFARLLSRNTVRDAYSRWRYGRPEADVESPTYVDKAMGLLPGWQQVVDG